MGGFEVGGERGGGVLRWMEEKGGVLRWVGEREIGLGGMLKQSWRFEGIEKK